jgi:rubredoxin
MWNDSLFFSRYARWMREQNNAGVDRETIRTEGLKLLVECVDHGEITCLDSCNSPVSRVIKEHHRATVFEMNSNWVSSPQDWRCPCCGRSKLQISRVGQHGQILAKSVVHHDHMGEVLRQAFNIQFVAAGTNLEQVDGLELVRRMSLAFAAYDEVLVCEDCNNADAHAKRLVEIPRDFSFSIGQIRTFIAARDHQPHVIDAEKVRRAWIAAEAAYKLRMRIVAAVAKAAATDRHWYEPNGKPCERYPVLGSEGRQDPCILDWFSTNTVVDALGAKTKVSAPNMRKWRTVTKKPSKTLPANYLALLLSDHFSALRWNMVEDNWRCPTCRRAKHEVVYIEKKGNVSMHLHEITSRAAAWNQVGLICNHCSSTLMSLKWELATYTDEALGIYDIVTPAELTPIIIPRAHSPHAIEPQRAEALVQTILSEGRVYMK